uniref:BPTI/Kunitz inhibitor domain-containing protein n=1 Tax=Fundulus heteroclitus TaxID=8078 RepID=A0A3Q2NVX5_FUNHE
ALNGRLAVLTGRVTLSFQIADLPLLPSLSPPDVCLLGKDSGSCRNYTFFWFYDSKKARCARFLYSGCGGNENRFGTREECEDTCLRKS